MRSNMCDLNGLYTIGFSSRIARNSHSPPCRLLRPCRCNGQTFVLSLTSPRNSSRNSSATMSIGSSGTEGTEDL